MNLNGKAHALLKKHDRVKVQATLTLTAESGEEKTYTKKAKLVVSG